MSAVSKMRAMGNLPRRLATCSKCGQGRGAGAREGAGEAVRLGQDSECGLKEDAHRPAEKAWQRNDWVACLWPGLGERGAGRGEPRWTGLRDAPAWEEGVGAASKGGEAGGKGTCRLRCTETGWWSKWTGTAGWNGNVGLWTALGGWGNGTRALWNTMAGY